MYDIAIYIYNLYIHATSLPSFPYSVAPLPSSSLLLRVHFPLHSTYDERRVAQTRAKEPTNRYASLFRAQPRAPRSRSLVRSYSRKRHHPASPLRSRTLRVFVVCARERLAMGIAACTTQHTNDGPLEAQQHWTRRARTSATHRAAEQHSTAHTIQHYIAARQRHKRKAGRQHHTALRLYCVRYTQANHPTQPAAAAASSSSTATNNPPSYPYYTQHHSSALVKYAL